MGDGDPETPSKTQKSSSTQEQPPPASPYGVYPDWASLQAYYSAAGATAIPPPGYFQSPISSGHQGHPYMWSPQMIPPYGTPPPAYVMYPPGLYPHPPVTPGSHPYNPYAMTPTNGTTESFVAAANVGDADGKLHEGKARSPIKRSRGSLGSLNMLNNQVNDSGKATGASGNGILSQSGESGSEGSSEATEGNSPNCSQQKQEDEHGSGEDETQNATLATKKSDDVTQMLPVPTFINQAVPVMAVPQGGLTGPTTSLNIGMDYWGASSATAVPAISGRFPTAPSTASAVQSAIPGPRDGVQSDLWIKDERELKREKRKQSNRESARRSRLRKQAECEELTRHVETLKEENDTLREELGRVRVECERLASENASLTERLKDNQETHQFNGLSSKGQLDCNTTATEKTEEELKKPGTQA